MAQYSLATGTTTIAERGIGSVAPSGEDAVSSVVFQIVSPAGSFSAIPRIAVEDSAQTGTNVQYYNLATGANLTAGTTITAAGIYAVYGPGCSVELIVSAGTATCFAQRLYGRVF